MAEELEGVWRLLTITDEEKDAVETTGLLAGIDPGVEKVAAFEEYNGDLRSTDYVFSRGIFWIRIYGLPLNLMSMEIAERLGRKIGNLVEINSNPMRVGLGRNIRLKVEIDITKPLRRFVTIVRGVERMIFGDVRTHVYGGFSSSDTRSVGQHNGQSDDHHGTSSSNVMKVTRKSNEKVVDFRNKNEDCFGASGVLVSNTISTLGDEIVLETQPDLDKSVSENYGQHKTTLHRLHNPIGDIEMLADSSLKWQVPNFDIGSKDVGIF
ncbi:hypothetical protein PTKIN_Ptkin09bG0171800 [Pterospermum kingtungense]